MTVFLFPGQGSQQRGMGADLFDEVAEFADLESQIDQLLGYSLRSLCRDDPGERLKDTRYTQPCLYVVNALYYFKELRRGERPTFLAGHSLGEYNALLAAGAFDFITGLRIVQKRGELMAATRNGAMAAVIGIRADRVADVLREGAFVDLEVANFNAPLQTIISGPAESIGRARSAFDAAGATMYVELPVSAAFHSRYMAEVARVFAEYLMHFEFASLQTSVIANVTGQPYPPGDPTDTVRSLLVRQVSHPVLWDTSIRYLLARGETSFKELGPGVVLTRLMQQIAPQVDPRAAAAEGALAARCAR